MANYTPSQVYDKYVALQKQLATNINNKGVTASQTELYDNLIDKVAQIENLKGEERTLENFTNVLSEPKSIVQLEYPEPELENLFSIGTIDDWTSIKNIGRITLSNNTITATASATFTTGWFYNTKLKFSSGTYTFSSTSTYKNNYAIIAYDSTDNIISTENLLEGWTLDGAPNIYYYAYYGSENKETVTVTIPDSIAYWYIGLGASRGSDTTPTTYSNIKVETTSTPTPKTLNAKLGSKNLFDTASAVKLNGSSSFGVSNNTIGVLQNTDYTYQSANVLIPNSLVGKTMTISAKSNASGANVAGLRIQWLSDAGLASGDMILGRPDSAGNIVATGTVPTQPDETYNNLCLLFYSNTGGSLETGTTYTVTYSDIQLELGSTATAYTPYISDFSTVNVTKHGKNLIPYPYAYTTQTISGVTFTVNSDGSVTVNGTATANATFELETDLQMFTLPAADYFLSGCPSGGSTTSYFMTAANGAGISYDKFRRDFGTGVAVPSSGENWKVSIRIMSGYTANNLVFKPQIELGTTATEYEPYQGQTYTPTSSGEVTGITNLYPLTQLLTNNSGVVFEQVTGQTYKEILPSTDKNGITKVLQPAVDSTIDSNITSDNIKQGVSILGVTGDYICNYTYDETSKELVLLI